MHGFGISDSYEGYRICTALDMELELTSTILGNSRTINMTAMVSLEMIQVTMREGVAEMQEAESSRQLWMA
jgi:hypothetical protein